MAPNRPNRIAFFRRRRGLSQQQLAEKVDAHWITISKLERGKIKLTEAWLERLATALDVDHPLELFAREQHRQSINVDGSIWPGGVVHISDEHGERLKTEIDLSLSETGMTFWLA